VFNHLYSLGLYAMKLLQTIHNIDLQTFHWCLRRKYWEPSIKIYRLVSASADGHLYLLINAMFIIFEHWLALQVFVLGLFIERFSYFILKNKLRRSRPQQTIPGFFSVIEANDQFSFPSGHTSAAFLATGLLATFFPLALIPLLIWAINVGISRIILGVHFPSDCLAGAALGFSISQYSLYLLA
jgi:undecaprenyl-diphosphatase